MDVARPALIQHAALMSPFVKILTYTPYTVGLVLLVLGRFVTALQGSFWAGVALLLIALSCFIFAATPGAGEINPQHQAMLKMSGIDYRPGMGRIANVVLGACAVAGGLYLLAR